MTRARFVVYARKSPGDSAHTSVDYQVEWGIAEGRRRGMVLATDLGVRFYKGEPVTGPTVVEENRKRRTIAPVPGCYIDELSHGTSVRRQAFWTWLDDAHARKFAVAMVHRGDRVSRNTTALKWVVAAFEQMGLLIYAGDNPSGDHLASAMIGVLGAKEVESIRVRTKQALVTIRKTKRLGRRPRGFLADGLVLKPTSAALSLFESARGRDPHEFVGTPEALALGLHSVTAVIVMFANIRAYKEGRLEERLAEQRVGTRDHPGRDERNRKADENDKAEETRLMHQLLDYVPDIRKVL